MKFLTRITTVAAISMALAMGTSSLALAQAKTDFKVAWSIYVGWMPWGYAADSVIVQR